MNKTDSASIFPAHSIGAPASGPGEAVGAEQALTLRKALLPVFGAAAAFNVAYTFPRFSFLMAVYLWCLFRLTSAKNSRQAFYFAFSAALLSIAPQSGFIWTIFGPAALALWTILAFWTGLFVALGHAAKNRFGPRYGLLLIPFLWTGLEYFRSELYYLRFSWLNVGYVFAKNTNALPIGITGMYGIGFILMAVIAAASMLKGKKGIILNCILLLLLGVIVNNSPRPKDIERLRNAVFVAGVQLEFSNEQQVISALGMLVKKHPNSQLLLLSEYTFAAPLPDSLKDWCRKNKKYLVVGAEDPAPNDNYYDTAFVIGPTGDIVFKQGKCVPIQFFKDGLPAKKQELWYSPWGKIGFCVCYDLSYTRVTDELIRQGAQAIIVPTMDVVEWGRYQHELHARVALTRVAEYGVPIFRLASSGISQFIDEDGRLLASAPMPGSASMLSATLGFAPDSGHLPWDRSLAKIAVAVTALSMGWFAVLNVLSLFRKQKPS